MSHQPEIEIVINGEPRQVRPDATVTDLVAELGLTPERLAIEYNLAILSRSKWSSTTLEQGDRLEIVHFVGGGASETTDVPSGPVAKP
jgi:thiamine biosynthesis protein ThiS